MLARNTNIIEFNREHECMIELTRNANVIELTKGTSIVEFV